MTPGPDIAAGLIGGTAGAAVAAIAWRWADRRRRRNRITRRLERRWAWTDEREQFTNRESRVVLYDQDADRAPTITKERHPQWT